jgi:two-component system sensor histidine kinase/response regulator
MTNPATILLVEDDRTLLDGIADLLEISNLGYDLKILKAADGEQALQVLSERQSDLIISDIMMPRTGGFELLRRLRETPEWVQIPVIFLTARGARQDVLEGRLRGAELYITKPYDSDELLQLVKGQLDRTFELQGEKRRKIDILSQNIVQLLNHEIRTPLTYVQAYYELLAEDLYGDDRGSVQQYLQGIHLGAERLKRLVDDLILVLELRSGEAAERHVILAEPIADLSILLQSLCNSQWVRPDGKRALIKCQVPDELPVVFADRDSILNICKRLIENGVKFSPNNDETEIRVSLEAGSKNGEVYFCIQDNGVGLPGHIHSQVFELFFQHNRESLEQQGAGAGLAIVKGLVDLNLGRIELQSEEGRGSKFTVFLPIYAARKGKPGPLAGQLQEKIRATILLVEDEWFLLEGLQELIELHECDYELKVLKAIDGMEALEVLAGQQPDMIISDIMMPNMDGYEFLSRVRANPAWIHIPVIFLTAKGDREDILFGRRSGAEEYITKPYDTDEMLSLVVAQLDRYFQRQSVVRKDLEELKRGVLDLLSSDFQMPLSVLSDYTDELASNLEMVRTEADLAAYLRGIQTGSSEVSRLAEDFIFLTSLRTGEASGAFSARAMPQDPAHILENVWRSYEHSSEFHSIRIDSQIGNCEAHIDAETFTNCIHRLIKIVTHTGQDARKSELHLSLTREDGEVRLGVGHVDPDAVDWDEDRLKHLLDQPGAVIPELSEYDPGLIIAKGIVDLHSGRLAVVRNSRLGYEFVIRLPMQN